MKYYKYLRIILILIPIIILGVLVYKDICPSGVLEVDYDFCKEDPFVSKFSPMGRVLEIERVENGDGKYCQQKMVIDPVYFDVRLPQGFAKAQLKIWYQKKGETPLRIGPRFNAQEWVWDLKDVRYIRQQGDWKVGVAEFDLSTVQMERNFIRFMISSPGLDESEEEIVFKRVEIRFEKKALSKSKL